MDYRGIVTQGYHVDAGGQNSLSIVSMGYISILAEIKYIFNIVEQTAYFQVTKLKDVLFGKVQADDTKFTITKSEEVLF
ncbi:MAG: hypothetical protein HZA08_04855 [Nitrospirae bacterium]|nr:hypothetical protein [Nitrospirota bacterium]